MTYAIDPEVLADLQLRESSRRDSTRTRGAGIYDWKKPKFVGTWRCRSPVCGASVGYTQEDHETAEVFDRERARRGEPPLDRKTIALCSTCNALRLKQRADKNRAQVDELAEIIRAVKDSTNPRDMHAEIKRMRELHHPDVDGLLQSVEARLNAGGKRTRGTL